MSTDQNAGESDRNIPPPPMIIPHGELRPVIEPPLRDLAPFPGTDVVEEWKPFASGPGENKLPDDLVRKAQDVALADERVKRLLAQKRYIAIRFMKEKLRKLFCNGLLGAVAMSVVWTGATGARAQQVSSGEESVGPGAIKPRSAVIPPNTPDVVRRKLVRRDPRFTHRKQNRSLEPRTKFEEGPEQGPERVSPRENFEPTPPRAPSRSSNRKRSAVR